MKKVLKQTLSVLLAVVIVFTITLPAFAEENLASETQTEQNLSYNSSNALGDTIVNAIEDENAVRDEYDGKGIFNVSLVGLEATVALSAPDDCTVVVSVYEEETMQMVTSGKAAVSSDDMEVVVTLADYELPDFFVVKAFILNSKNEPVCPSFVDLYNTRAYVESMAKTTEDFDSELVINLDESVETNFAVVTDDAVVAQVDDEKNVIISVDDENGIYVIKNADDSITSLNEGDILYYTYGDGINDYILTKVGKIETKEGLTTITASDDYEMSDFFDYIDIDTSKQAAPQTYGLRGSWNEDAGSYGDTTTFPISSGSAELKFSGEKWSLSFKVDGAVTFYLKFFYDFNFFTKDYYEFAYWVQIDASAKASFDFKSAYEKKVTLIDTNIVVVPGLDIHFALKFTVKVSGEINATGTITFAMKNGVSRNSYGEQQKIEQKPTITPKLEISGKVSVSLIPEIETGFQIVKVFFVDLNVPVEFNLTGTLYVPTSSADREKHSCTICVDGKIKATVSLNISVKFGLKRSKAESIISFTAASKTVEFGSFYISGSGSGIKFGWGKCPNTYLGSDLGGSDDENEEIRTVIDNGTCGENLIWTLYDDGELVIDGEGDMYNYYTNEPPWKSYANLIKNVKIGNGVTKIGDYSFYLFFTNIENLIIGDSVKIVGDYAFASAEKLKNIRFSNSITTIGNGAFSSCDGLVNITIPDSVSTIGSYSFEDCRNLKKVIFGDGLTTIPRSAFHYCTALTDIIIPDNITAIGYCSFMYCNIQNIYYSGTIEQWNEITIYANNDSVLTANIICSEMVSFMLLTPDNKISVYSANNIQSETITDALIGNDYVMIVVKDENAEDLLAPENLLYIDQKTAESEDLTFEYVIDESITDYDVLVFGQKLPHYHLYDGMVTTPRTCTEQGFTTYTCSCGDTYIDDYVDSTGHTDEIIPGYAATCTQTGLTDGVKCSVCGTITTEQKTIPVVSHNDGNHDGLCDACDFDFTNGCSHTCHSDNAFMQFLWRIISFLQKLFGNKSAQYCDCGVAHW